MKDDTMDNVTWDQLETMQLSDAQLTIKNMNFDRLWALVTQMGEDEYPYLREFVRDRFADIAATCGNGMDLCMGINFTERWWNAQASCGGTKNRKSYTYKVRKAVGYSYP